MLQDDLNNLLFTNIQFYNKIQKLMQVKFGSDCIRKKIDSIIYNPQQTRTEHNNFMFINQHVLYKNVQINKFKMNSL